MIDVTLIIGLNAATLGFMGVITSLVWKMNRELGQHGADITYIKKQIDNNNKDCEESEDDLEND